MVAFLPALKAGEISSVKLPLASDMTRAELSYVAPPPRPRGVLVLCPGCNGNGIGLIRQQAWQDFARRENLVLVGLHFQSPIELLSQCQGYYQASRGSGEALLQGLREICGKDLPILISGFSGGAHFTTRFIAWKPDRVITWAALGAGVLDAPAPAQTSPPGIMACGANDSRLGGALTFYKQGRAAGKPWLWVEIPHVGHATSPTFDEFIRSYFASRLNQTTPAGEWVDIDLKTKISSEEAGKIPALSGWLPSGDLFEPWNQFREN